MTSLSKEYLAFSGSLAPIDEAIILEEPYHDTLTIKMSNPESANTSRSASPSTNPDPKPRLVSGSLKDRIAKFNNPSAAPLLPSHPFGTGGSNTGPGAVGKKGLYGNRIPTLDPKSAGHIPTSGSARKVSESRGLIGNRIPSSVSGGSVAGLASYNTGGSGVPAPKPSLPGMGRPASPTGSIGSSTPSGPAESGTPSTSRSSSPPTSPGGGLPPSLLAATLPDVGGPGAMTPSSTRADAGEEQEDRSAPSTPVVGATIQLPPAEYDLVPGNLRLATAAQMTRGLSATSAAPRSFAPSVTSSLASQYDPSSQGNEEKQMMQDVSGISTPTGTPRAAYRELEGSMRGEGSTRGEGSVVDEGSVVGDGDQAGEQKAMESVSRRLEGLALQQDEAEGEASVNAAQEEMVVDDQPTPSTDIPDPIAQAAPSAPTEDASPSEEAKAAPEPAEQPQPPAPTYHSAQPRQDEDDDPNKAPDLAALKRGDLIRSSGPGREEGDVNPLQSLSGIGYAGHTPKSHSPSKSDLVFSADHPSSAGSVVEERNKEIDEKDIELGPEMVVRPPTPGRDDKGAADHEVPVLRRKNPQEDEEIDILPPAAENPTQSPPTHELVADLGSEEKNRFVNEAFKGDMREPTEEEEESQKQSGELGPDEHVAHVGPGEVSAEERVNMGQSERSDKLEVGGEEAGGNEIHKEKDSDGTEVDMPDKREGKTYLGELEKERGGGLEGYDDAVPNAELGRGTDSRSGLAPLHFEDKDGRPIEVEGDLTKLPVDESVEASSEEKEGEAASVEDKDGEADTGVEEGEKEELKTKSEAPVLAADYAQEKPLQVQVEPAPLAQREIQPESSSPEIPNPFTSEPPSSSSPTTSKSESPVFPDPPHTDPSTDPEPPLSAASFTSTERSSTPLDPHLIRSFPEVPDEEHPRVEIHVSPHVTPAKSSLSPSASAFSPTKGPASASSPLKKEGSEEGRPQTPGALEVENTGEGEAGAKLGRRRSMRPSPKSPLLDDEDPGDYVPGEEGWAVVTKGRGA